METRNLSPFREFIKDNYKYALMYSNSTSSFSEQNFRADAFKIKSDLAHDVTKDEQLYMSLNLPRAITRIFTDYVIGLGYNVDFNIGQDINEAFIKLSDQTELQLKLDEAFNNQSSIGYWLLRLRNKNGKPRVEVIPLPNYLANMDGLTIGDDFLDIKEHIIYSVQRDRDGRAYFYVDRYEKIDDNKWMGYYWEKRADNGNYILEDRLEEGQEEELDRLPLYIFNNDLSNPHVVADKKIKYINRQDIGEIPRYFHQSDYRDLADLFQELNDRTSQISVEFIKNLTSKMSVPAGFRDAQSLQKLRNGDKTFAKNPDYLVHNPGEEPAKYITKDSTLVTVAINDYIPTLLKFVGFISSIPPVLLTNAIYGGNNPVWTTEKEFMPFYKRIESKQQRAYGSLQRLFKDIMEIAGYTVELPTIKFVKPAAYDIAERTNTAIAQLNAGIMSKESAITYAMGYDKAEVKEELEKINKETIDAYAQNNTNIVYEDEDVDEKNENLDENLDESENKE